MIFTVSDFGIPNKIIMLQHWLEFIELVAQAIPFEFSYFLRNFYFSLNVISYTF